MHTIVVRTFSFGDQANRNWVVDIDLNGRHRHAMFYSLRVRADGRVFGSQVHTIYSGDYAGSADFDMRYPAATLATAPVAQATFSVDDALLDTQGWAKVRRFLSQSAGPVLDSIAKFNGMSVRGARRTFLYGPAGDFLESAGRAESAVLAARAAAMRERQAREVDAALLAL